MPENYSTSQYVTQIGTSTGLGNWYTIEGIGSTAFVDVHAKTGIAPQLYFKYIKKKFGTLEKMRLDARLKRLEKAFHKAVDNGQEALGEKIIRELSRETRESMMYAKGIKHFIEYDDLTKFKNRIRGGHISDTKLKDFTRVIPKVVLEKKSKVEACFDGFVIYHYWDSAAEEKRQKKQKVTEEEKQRMRDPVLFGVIKESNRLYFVADWEDEHCDLTFEEMVDVIGKDDESQTIPRNPVIV